MKMLKTMPITYHNVHPEFRLNGASLNASDLCNLAHHFIKQGADFEKPAGEFLLQWFDDKSYVAIQTSGTTGTPKIIKVEKQAMIHSALATGTFFNLTAGNTALNCLPVKYIAGKMMLVRAFVLGLDLDFVAPSSKPMEHKMKTYDFVAMVPLQIENSVEHLHQIKKLIIGGAKINSALEEKLATIECQVFETYSMTETVTHIAAKKIGEKAFTVLPNVEISQDGRQCLVISAPNLNPDKIITNDIVALISDKKFIWLGRYDNVVNSGGIKLFPEQIESKISNTIAQRFFVAGIADAKLGEKLVLFIEGNPFDLDASVFDALDKYEKPKEVKFIPHFSETETGKIKRKEILNSL